MHTELCDVFGIEYPIFAFSHCRDVVAAVSKAGGMGAIGIARAEDADLLAAAGADIVVTSLDDVDLQCVADGKLARKQRS